MIVLLEPAAAVRESLLARLPARTEGVADHHAALARLDGGAGAVLVLGPGLGREEALTLALRLHADGDGTGAVLVVDVPDTEVLTAALRAGIDDVLATDAPPEEWEAAVARAAARHPGDEGAREPTPRGRVATVFATKGGCGRSLVATNLAVLAAQATGEDTALVDLDLQSGDLAIMLQLLPARSLYDVAAAGDGLDADALRGYLTPHRDGVQLLAAPMEPSVGEQVPPATVARVLALLPRMFPLTLVDGPPLFTDQLLVAFDASDVFVLVGSMDVPSIKNLKQAISTLNQLGHPREQLRIVLNRADSRVGLHPTEVERSLGVGIDVLVPSSRDVPLSINQGTPLASSRPRSPVVRAIAELLPAVLATPVSVGRRRARNPGRG